MLRQARRPRGCCGREGHPRVAGKLIHHSDAGSRYTSLWLTEHLPVEEIRPSIGSVGDAYDTHSIMGLWMAGRESDPAYDWRFELTV